MSVDEQIARAWGRLIGREVYESVDPLSSKSSPRKRWFVGGYMARYVTDPATHPWEWLIKFDGSWYEDINPPIYRFTIMRNEIEGRGRGDSYEAALQEAIRAWEASQ